MAVRGRHPHNRLTDLVARRLGPGRHADGNTLYLHVRPSGSRAWTQRLVVQGERRDRGLGGYPLVSLADARRVAKDNRRVARAGGDPFAVSAPKEVPTVRELYEAVIKGRREGWRHRATEAKWRLFFRKYVEGPIGDKPVDKVSVDDVLGIVAPRWAGRGSDGWVLRLQLNQVMKLAVVRGCRGDNPAENVQAVMPSVVAVVEHHPSLSHRRVREAMRAVLESRHDEAKKLALLFTVLTASRVSEVTGAPWTEFDLEAGIWTRPAERMKGQVEHPVPLSVQAVQILDRARALGRSGDFVFVVPRYRGRGSVRPLTPYDLSKVLKPLGYVDKEERPIVTHGFRRTFRTWGSKVARARFEVLETALAHLSSATVRAYFDAETELVDERRELMQAWADYVLPREEDG